MKIILLLLSSLSLTFSSLIMASSIKDDETVIFFPTNAYLNGPVWVVPIHGWIFEMEKGSIWRKATANTLASLLEVEPDATNRPIYEQRAAMFLVDNERGKEIEIELFGKRATLKESAANGHFYGVVHIDRNRIGADSKNNWAAFQAITQNDDPRLFQGKAHLIGPQGLSVISDIDDTIKISNVKDKEALLKNTFLKDFSPVPGMAEVYRSWQQDGAVFHYLSASPWQLYPALSSFIAAAGFPDGSYNLKKFRLKDETFFNLFTSHHEHKISNGEILLRQYPGRRFILVGDAGENDPEICAMLARKYPNQVYHIFIRDLEPDGTHDERYKTTFKGLPESQWTLFRDGSDLADFKLPKQTDTKEPIKQ